MAVTPAATGGAAAAGADLFGLAVWVGSDLGCLPAGRNLMMVVAHLVWGALLGAGTGLAASPRPRIS